MIALPEVDPRRCTNCGDCVVACPTACLARGQTLPWLPRPLACVSCGLCALVCPAEAIALVEDAEAGDELPPPARVP